ncbi:MAG: hypothetical protein HPY62_03390 [Bacteroidales bacterium]|nr:hypothetical protein [Bacteroidales bacterium]
MSRPDKFDRTTTGALAGFILPILTGLLIYLFSSKGLSLSDYFTKIVTADIITHIISLSVLPNILIFLVFNRLDMLKASRGVVGITLFWAIIVFAVKFLA